jgi:hypothetical protein
MKSVTQNEWAEYLSNLRVYQTEYIFGNHSVMYSKLAQGPNVGMEVAEAHYCANSDQLYYIKNGD